MLDDIYEKTRLIETKLVSLAKRFASGEISHLQCRQKNLSERMQILHEKSEDGRSNLFEERGLLEEIIALERDCQIWIERLEDERDRGTD
jgi:hypothetical protein